jgi:hypothetical protein
VRGFRVRNIGEPVDDVSKPKGHGKLRRRSRTGSTESVSEMSIQLWSAKDQHFLSTRYSAASTWEEKLGQWKVELNK